MGQRNYRRKKSIFTRFGIGPLVFVAVIFSLSVFAFVKTATERTRVLGVTSYLADRGSDHQDKGKGKSPEDKKSSDKPSESVQNAPPSESGSANNNAVAGRDSEEHETEESTSEVTQSELVPLHVSDTSLVDCIGPDGIHVQKTFRDCEDFNAAWHNDNFHFTLLTTPTPQKNESSLQQKIEPRAGVGLPQQAYFDVERHGSNQWVRLQTKGTEVEIANKKGALSITAKPENRQEVELDHDSLDDINSVLGDEYEVSATGAAISVRQRRTELDTHFPLSIDLATKSLVVTTPAGTKQVAVLPDDAVNALLAQHILTSVESESQGENVILRKVTLGETDTTLSFTVKGMVTRRFLGLFPRAVERKVVISAENGAVLSVNESFGNKLLDLFSL